MPAVKHLNFLKRLNLSFEQHSEVEIVDNGGELEIKPEKAEGEKCERCWAVSKTVGQCAEHPTICFRCVQNLK